MKNPPVKKQKFRTKEGRLICPACGESLSRQDVESYVRCPYCDHQFALNEEMEDFLLQPIVDNWCQMNQSQQKAQFTQEQEISRSNWI